MIEGITSDLQRAENAMQPRTAIPSISVYTESHEDIGFWRSILDDFEVASYKFVIYPASKTTNIKGKHEALARELDILQPGVGEYMIICIDSDYDYLLRDANAVSKMINESPYIFQTYVYSIENYMCHAEGLHSVCTVTSNNDERDVDFVAILQEYSRVIYKLLLLSVWLAKKGDCTIFTFSNFSACVSFPGKLNVDKKDEWMADLNGRVDRKYTEICAAIQAKYFVGNPQGWEGEFKELERETSELELNPENAYLFLKGHILRDTFIHHLLWPICEKRKEETKKQIVANGQDNPQDIDRNIKEFKNKCRKLEDVLEIKAAFKNKCSFYLKLKADLQGYVDSLPAQN